LTSKGSIKRALYLLYSQLLRCSGGEVELVHRTLYRYLTTTAEDLRAIPQALVKEELKGWVITHQPEFYMRPQTSHAELELLCVKYLNMAWFPTREKASKHPRKGGTDGSTKFVRG